MTDLRPQSEGFSFYRVPRQLVKGTDIAPCRPRESCCLACCSTA